MLQDDFISRRMARAIKSELRKPDKRQRRSRTTIQQYLQQVTRFLSSYNMKSLATLTVQGLMTTFVCGSILPRRILGRTKATCPRQPSACWAWIMISREAARAAMVQ